MIESDTVKMLQECDSGIKMGVAAIDEVLDYVRDEELSGLLAECREEHDRLKSEIQVLLDKYHDEGKRAKSNGKKHVMDKDKC